MEPFKPSAYVPFLRRFTNERQRELDEAEQLYWWVEGRQRAFNENATTIGRRVAPCFRNVSEDLFTELAWVMHDLIAAEAFMQTLPTPSFDRMNMKEFVGYRSLLEAKQYFFVNQTEILELFTEGLIRLFGGLAEQLPLIEDPSPFTIPLAFTLQNPGLTADQIFGTLWDEPYRKRWLFRHFGDLLYRNRCMVSGNEALRRAQATLARRRRQHHADRRGWSARYLANSPFEELLQKPVPLKLTYEDRFNHMHVVGWHRRGKDEPHRTSRPP